MGNREHFDDLSRRYLEKDEVSEYQRLWAIFNHWLTSHTGGTNDRQCIELIKKDLRLQEWVKFVLDSSKVKRPHQVADGFDGSHPRFASDNVISLLFKAVLRSQTLKPRIHYPWRKGSEGRVRPLNAIVLDNEQFRLAYNFHSKILTEGIADFHLTIHQTLPSVGIYSTGCCFYRGSSDTTLPANTPHYANRLIELFRTREELSELVNLAESTNTTQLSSDIIETLYNVRNVSMHGSLDFLNENDNTAARAGYEALDSLIRHIRDYW